jgi:hypothetical protein
VLLEQMGVPFATMGQALPHMLQFCGSLVVSVQVPLHRVGLGGMQPLTQLVPLQSGVLPPQVTMHAPQLGDLLVSASQPLSGFPSQFAQPVAQDDIGKLHAPLAVHMTGPLTWARFEQS